jgi:hypothetical protein
MEPRLDVRNHGLAANGVGHFMSASKVESSQR